MGGGGSSPWNSFSQSMAHAGSQLAPLIYTIVYCCIMCFRCDPIITLNAENFQEENFVCKDSKSNG